MELEESLSGKEWPMEDHSSTQPFKVDFNARMIRDSKMIEMGRKLLLHAKLGHTSEVKDLMANGAPFTADWVGTSPLHWAAINNHVEVTALLLKAGISRNAKNKVDRTPLHIAAQKGHFEIMRLLITFGADVNGIDMLRMTPLHWAAENGPPKCVQLLLDYGASPDVVSKFDKTPAQIAMDRGHAITRNLLELASSCDSLFKYPGDPILNCVKEDTKARKNRNSKASPKKENSMSSKFNGQSVLETQDTLATSLKLLQEHTMIESDEKPDLSDTLASGKSVTLTEAGKLALSSISNFNEKDAYSSNTSISLPSSSTVNTETSPQVETKLSGLTKKVITIKADQLINMTKERKVIIRKEGKTINLQGARVFEGRIYTQDQEEELIEKVKTKLFETTREAQLLKSQALMKEHEAEKLKRQLESLMKSKRK